MEDNPQKIAQLMLNAKAGDDQAFGFVYNSYFTPVYRYIYTRVSNKGETEDLVQTVFLKAFNAISNFEYQNKSPLAYFFTIARNTVINHERKKKPIIPNNPIEEMDIKDEETSPQKDYEQKELQIKVKKILSKLNDTQRQMIILKFFDGLSNKEIADFLNKKEDAIRQLQCRAVKKMNKLIKELK